MKYVVFTEPKTGKYFCGWFRPGIMMWSKDQHLAYRTKNPAEIANLKDITNCHKGRMYVALDLDCFPEK